VRVLVDLRAQAVHVAVAVAERIPLGAAALLRAHGRAACGQQQRA